MDCILCVMNTGPYITMRCCSTYLISEIVLYLHIFVLVLLLYYAIKLTVLLVTNTLYYLHVVVD